MSTPRRLHPLLVMLLWLAAAFIVIGIGPMVLFPSTNSFIRFEAVLWKMFGASLFLGASLYLLRRSDWGIDALGLTPNLRSSGWLLAGSIAGVAIVGLCLLLFRSLATFQFERGMILPVELAISVLVYFFGALLEELAFRGYPLLRLKEHYGSFKAILIVSLAFGVLHLPGMHGMNAVKMIVTTGLCSVIFSIAYLRSRTLWTAVGLHMGMNVALHSIFGSGGGQSPSLLKPMFVDASLLPIDAGFWSFVVATLITIVVMIFLWPHEASARRTAAAAPA